MLASLCSRSSVSLRRASSAYLACARQLPHRVCTTPGRFGCSRSLGWSLILCAASSSSAGEQPKYRLRPLTKDDVECSFARSSGAGGQNVNKVNTKVNMRWDLSKTSWIPEDVKEAIRSAEKNRFTSDGVLVMTSMRHRTQVQNLEDALEKLQEIVDRAVWAVTPKVADEATVKRVKANVEAGNQRRLQDKKMDSMRKSDRRQKNWD